MSALGLNLSFENYWVEFDLFAIVLREKFPGCLFGALWMVCECAKASWDEENFWVFVEMNMQVKRSRFGFLGGVTFEKVCGCCCGCRMSSTSRSSVVLCLRG